MKAPAARGAGVEGFVMRKRLSRPLWKDQSDPDLALTPI